ncbi:MAG: hypothetical protein QOK45_495 [Mycobacterium sp.]|nr:hypothetical protein [Mycobacterium sp.]
MLNVPDGLELRPAGSRTEHRRRRRSVLAVAAIAVVAGSGTFALTTAAADAASRTLLVPTTYRTISAAVKAAHSGDTVLVAPGTYRENVTIDGKYVVVRARSTNPAATVITGRAGRTTVMIANVPTRRGVPRAALIGFRVTGGSASGGTGGGITALNHGDALIEKNLIDGNRAQHGGGVLVYGSSNPVITYNTIRGNHGSIMGGGVFVAMHSSPRIYGNTIQSNTVSGGTTPGGGPSGGGIYISNDGNNPAATRSAPNVSRNTIVGNTVSFAGGGIVLGTGANAIIASNRISSNRSAYGGGIHIENHGAAPSITQNLIEANTAARSSAYPGSGSGGGISVFGGSRPKIGHNTIRSNRTSYAGGGIVLAEGSFSAVNGNRIIGNQVVPGITGSFGGGIGVATAGGRLTNNVMQSNSAPVGGGIAMLGTGAVQVVNNVIVSNKATLASFAAGGGLYIGAKPVNSTSIINNVVTDNNDYQIFENGRIARYSANLVTNTGKGLFFSFPAHELHSAAQFNGNAHVLYAHGNIATAPTFIDAATGNLALSAGSAGVNQGTALGATGVDINNRARPVGGRFDVGAWER